MSFIPSFPTGSGGEKPTRTKGNSSPNYKKSDHILKNHKLIHRAQENRDLRGRIEVQRQAPEKILQMLESSPKPEKQGQLLKFLPADKKLRWFKKNLD